MIEKLFKHPHVLHQSAPENALPEGPLHACMDATGLIILSQEGRYLCINVESVPELRRVLATMAKLKP